MSSLTAHIYTLILGTLIFYAGKWIFRLAPFLKKLNLPVAVVGALVFLPFFNLAELATDRELEVPGRLRDFLLVVFFCTMGLAVKFRETINGGKQLVLICVLSILLVILQNILSVAVMLMLGHHPAFGLLSGSISFVGGFGSSLAWGSYYAEKGLPLALEVGFACSAFGLICGGLFAGPTVAWILKREKFKTDTNFAEVEETIELKPGFLQQFNPLTFLTETFKIIAALWLSVYLGDALQTPLKNMGMDLPRFLTAMLVAIFIVNVFCHGIFSLSEILVDKIGDISFNLFIIVGLITMNIAGLSDYFLPIMLILILQIILTVLFSSEVIFRAMGKDYDSAVLCGGVIGFGLSSVAVAMATVKTIIRNHGPAPRALLLTSLVGAALIDLPNNLLIGLLTRFDFFAPP